MHVIKSKIDDKYYVVMCTNELTYDIIELGQTDKDYNPINCMFIDIKDCEEVCTL